MKASLKTLTFNPRCLKAPIVSLQGQPVLLFTQQHTSLLMALEQKKVKLFSECRNGYCGACKTKIISGSVIYHAEPLVHLEKDECLPCCCSPSSDLNLELSPQGIKLAQRSQLAHPTPETQNQKPDSQISDPETV
ncbi:2Fe-2S iron-sulfur cluster binding domain-containing protein [Shewanella sp. D64]|uniref:class I ribonucleotide reductase maintenance protein YfaE n=1 Tax=unclassified Shewanella TaxID=196818 RepID=UPI0022BA2D42|nr:MULTISPECIES: class I ribonucleotide reductase maintenance protein YfaE [unclassified Shewanella]MEC4724108.1 2Fe-2S iron-sulfur cluster binding domain-containing protein [Shewanella sp. D64]MEC4736128.1 2Fe-2S iron-sulfur cluster binding domain-containing protein [Shewanella sp. E94]WBJ97930.1 2Fe-2S iron-sulfur cluster binding domain-containing protein [Shewanella sp. MTB7]